MIDFFLIFFKCRLRCPSAFLRQASGYRVLPIVNFRLPGPYSLGGLTAASAGADPCEMAETRKPAVHPSAKGGGRQDSGARNFKPTGSFPSCTSASRVPTLFVDLRLRPPGRIPLKRKRPGSQPCTRTPRAEVGTTPELGILNLPDPSHLEGACM